jgi:hypothetical protein
MSSNKHSNLPDKTLKLMHKNRESFSSLTLKHKKKNSNLQRRRQDLLHRALPAMLTLQLFPSISRTCTDRVNRESSTSYREKESSTESRDPSTSSTLREPLLVLTSNSHLIRLLLNLDAIPPALVGALPPFLLLTRNHNVSTHAFAILIPLKEQLSKLSFPSMLSQYL